MSEENSHIQASKDRFLKIYGMDNKYDAPLIRSAMLVNGGAAIALLAFIGSVWSKGLDGRSLQLLSNSLTFFSSGVGLAFASMFFCYLRSNIFIDNSFSNEKEAEQKWTVTICKNLKVRASLVLIPTLILMFMPLLVSFACFMYGVSSAIETFYTHLSFAAGK